MTRVAPARLFFADRDFGWHWCQLWQLVGEAVEFRRRIDLHNAQARADWAAFLARFGMP